ncbi:MAG: hypothetical protein CMF60_07490 [Magnetococcales bacterium]|nr:hypothetical protein [Magnetococcales bacterium]|tara:strand:+ start:8235 stop:8873 length:639 start_codon:yes stop_codon:yes gene_type:complete
MNITSITPDGVILSTQAAEIFRQIQKLENKDDPNRRGDLYGPYEAVWLARTGQLPPEYFEENDPEPWKLLGDEARRNILWQALSGCLDFNAEWALIYIQLVMDDALDDDDFAKELAKVNKQFLHSLDHRYGDHHTHMKHKVGHIDCPGCSATAALLMIDPQLRSRFEGELAKLNKLTPAERMDILRVQGLEKYLNATIQDEKGGKIILPDSE